MKTTVHNHRLIVYLMCGALLTPRPGLLGSERQPARPHNPFRATDVCLAEHGQFGGQIVDAQGHGAAGIRVELWTNGKLIRQSVADEKGQFEFAGLRTGVYQVLAPGTGGVVRLWQADAAPPAARTALLLVQGPVVRGQYSRHVHTPQSGVYDGAVMKALSNPWLFSGLLAAGIAIPIALSNSDNDNEGS